MKLKQPLWQDIIYYCLIGLAPIIITCMELFSSHSSIFKISFASVGAILITMSIVRRFVLKGKIAKIKTEIIALEHDYSIKVGDPTLTQQKWKRLNLIIHIYDSLVVILWLLLSYLFITALVDSLIAFKGAALLILLFVLAGTLFKVFTFVGKKSEDNDETKQ